MILKFLSPKNNRNRLTLPPSIDLLFLKYHESFVESFRKITMKFTSWSSDTQEIIGAEVKLNEQSLYNNTNVQGEKSLKYFKVTAINLLKLAYWC